MAFYDVWERALQNFRLNEVRIQENAFKSFVKRDKAPLKWTKPSTKPKKMLFIKGEFVIGEEYTQSLQDTENT